MNKKYVPVVVFCDEEGNKIPKQIFFNEECFVVDKVLDKKNASSLKVGGIGERYLVKINGKQTFLFFENETNKWFVEEK